MKRSRIILGLTAITVLSACGSKFDANSAPSSESNGISSIADAAPVAEAPATTSEKVIQDIGKDLREKSMLSEEQIAALLASATSAVKSGGLSSSNSVNMVLPTIIQGITQGLGKQGLGADSAKLTNLISLIGKIAIDTTMISSGGALSAGMLKVLATTLFQNLGSAGGNAGNLSGISGTLMSTLVAHIGKGGFQAADLSTLLQSLSSGAVLGVGNLNLSGLGGQLVSDIVKQIGAGSITGLSGVSNNSAILQTLIGAINQGSQSGLSQIVGKFSGSGLNLKDLLSTLIAGQTSKIGALPVGSIQQNVISLLLQALLSKG